MPPEYPLEFLKGRNDLRLPRLPCWRSCKPNRYLHSHPPRLAKKGLAGLFTSASEDELIEPDLAFQLKVAPKGPNTLVAELVPANGYYLYKERIRFSAAAHWHELPRQALTRLSVRLRRLEQ